MDINRSGNESNIQALKVDDNTPSQPTSETPLVPVASDGSSVAQPVQENRAESISERSRETIKEFTAGDDFGSIGKATLSEMFNDGDNVSDYLGDMTRYYNAGKASVNNTDVDMLSVPGNGSLNAAQAEAAFFAGQEDAKPAAVSEPVTAAAPESTGNDFLTGYQTKQNEFNKLQERFDNVTTLEEARELLPRLTSLYSELQDNRAQAIQAERAQNGKLTPNYDSPENFIDNRDFSSVGDRSIKAFQFDYPQLHPFLLRRQTT